MEYKITAVLFTAEIKIVSFKDTHGRHYVSWFDRETNIREAIKAHKGGFKSLSKNRVHARMMEIFRNSNQVKIVKNG